MALACHDSRPLLCVGFADGVLHAYDTARVQQSEGEDGGGGGGGGAQLQPQVQAGPEGDGEKDVVEEAGDAEEEDEEEDEGGAGAHPSVKLTKAQRQLLLVPVAALKLGTGPLRGALSCLSFSQEPDFLFAGTTGGELAVWSVSRALHAASAASQERGRSSSITLAKLMKEDNAALPLLR